MYNWESYIYELIELYRLSNCDMYREIEKEITKAYCHEFIDSKTRKYLIYYLKEQKEIEEKNDKLYHAQRLYEIAEKQDYIREQLKIKEILKKADDNYNRKFGKSQV